MAKHVKVAALAMAWPCAPEQVGAQGTSRAVMEHLDAHLAAPLAHKPDLVLLPEMCDRPQSFSQREYLQYVARRGDEVLAHLQKAAQRHRTFVVYPTVRPLPGGGYCNSALLIDRQGSVAGIYDKTHPTIGECEDGIGCGEGPLVVECELGRLGFAICFDLNFTGLLEGYRAAQPDLLLFPSAFHGGLQQSWWAFYSRSYFVGAAAGLGATVLAPTGEVLAASTPALPFAVHTVNLDRALVHLDYNREKLDAARAKYGPRIQVGGPGQLGAVLLTSESADFSARDILDEFGMETLDEYLARCADVQAQTKANRGRA